MNITKKKWEQTMKRTCLVSGIHSKLSQPYSQSNQ